MPILDLNNADKLFYQGVEYDKLYYGDNELWKKKPTFVPLPLPRNKTPDIIDGVTAKWTIKGVTPNKRYQVNIWNVKGGIMRASQVAMGNSDLKIAGVSGGFVSTTFDVTNPEGVVYIVMSDVYTGTPDLTMTQI